MKNLKLLLTIIAFCSLIISCKSDPKPKSKLTSANQTELQTYVQQEIRFDSLIQSLTLKNEELKQITNDLKIPTK